MGLKLKPKVYIDGDIVLYSCGFSAQRRWYRDDCGKAWPTITAAKEGGCDPDELELIIEPEPFSHAAHNANLLIQSVADATKLSPVVVLSGPTNYRNERATIFPYKGTRTGEKPVHYDELKTFLVEEHQAIVTDGEEADDYLGSMCSHKGLAAENENIMATLDKDLDMVPGVHYNWKSENLYNVTHEEGMYNFFLQVLTGDKTDNIVSPKGLGPVKANRILTGTRDWYQASFRAYRDYLRSGSYRTELEAAIAQHRLSTTELARHWLHENMDLLWIRRAPDDEWVRHRMWFSETYHGD